MGKVLAFVLAGGRSENLGVLTKHRAMAAVPFGGRYRVIDFTLSNCVNSRVHTVQIATQYSPHSLQQHLQLGRPWDLDRRDGGVWLLQPYMGRTDSNWYRGTADALYQNLDMIGTHRPEMILVLSGDQVYRMDYGEMIRQHRRNKAEITIAVKAMEPTAGERFGMVEIEGSRIVRFDEKPSRTTLSFANLAIYLFDARYLIDRLSEAVPGGRFDLVWDVIIPAVHERRVAPYLFEGYWEDLGTLDSYYLANRTLLPASSSYLLDPEWPIFTSSEERPPAKFGATCSLHNTVVANGCRIFGHVENTILFPGVLVGEGSVVRDSILLSGAQVHRNCRISRSILDKKVIIGDGAILGAEHPVMASLGRVTSGDPEVCTEEGLLVVGKDTHIPPGFECRRPAMFDSHLSEDAVRHAVGVTTWGGTMRIDVYILAGGQGSRLSVLSEHRAKPAVPFAGKYRIIDFTLTNCVYSGLFHIRLLTQYRPRSLVEHVGVGKPWDLDRKWGGIEFLHPYLGWRGSSWYAGTADALVQNLNRLSESDADEILVLSGDHVYKMNYEQFLESHRQQGGDATVAVLEVPWEETRHFGILRADSSGRIVDFEEKPEHAQSNLASMGVYVFKRRALMEVLERLKPEYPNLDFGKHVIPSMVPQGQVASYRYGGYWLDIGTVHSYYAASMDLLRDEPPLNLFDPEWHILTREHNRPPTCIESGAHVRRSFITDGCSIAGTVEGSVLGPGVVVEPGAVVRDSVLMDDCLVRRDAIVERCIFDKRVRVGASAVVGLAEDGRHNEEQPDVLGCGITLVGQGARVPAHQRIGTNCLIGMHVGPEDFQVRALTDGTALRGMRAEHPVR